MALQGYTELQFSYDGFKTIAHSTGKKNAITPWVQNAIGAGNFHSLMDRSKIMPLSQWFDGCLLCDKEHEFALATSMIDYDAGITACAGSEEQAGVLSNNSKLGTFQPNQSGMTADGKGMTFCWEWGTAYGIGDIKSVCLTRAKLAIADLVKADETGRAMNLEPFDTLGSMTIDSSVIGANNLHIIDYSTGRGYYISPQPTASSLTIDEYDIGTNYLRIYNEAGRTIRKIGETHEFTGLTNLVQNRCSANYTGDAIRIFWWSGTTISEVTIDISTWTMSSITTHTYSGANFYATGNYIKKDKFVLKGNYLYLLGTTSSSGDTIYKCNLTSAEIVAIDNPLFALGIQTEMGASVTLPNGDVFWQNTYNNSRGLLLHNDIWYAVKGISLSSSTSTNGINGNDYGTVLASNQNRADLFAFFGYISTVNNLGRTYTKNSSMSMRLIYTVSEV